MSAETTPIPVSSQTVGPYFRIGLEYLLERSPALGLDSPKTIELRGRVLDRDGAPVPDAMLEFWSAETGKQRSGGSQEPDSFPEGFRRVMTNGDGRFSTVIERPTMVAPVDGRTQTPHIMVLVFARGLLRHLITRVYLGDEKANEIDTLLMGIPEERRLTLIARPDDMQAGLYCWDVILQGTGETVFFAW
jgi:protocatechuate 3,4-dioxygenase alpha subunit